MSTQDAVFVSTAGAHKFAETAVKDGDEWYVKSYYEQQCIKGFKLYIKRPKDPHFNPVQEP